jgi:hypothetical protein
MQIDRVKCEERQRCFDEINLTISANRLIGLPRKRLCSADRERSRRSAAASRSSGASRELSRSQSKAAT